MGINCLRIPPPLPAEDGFQAHFQQYFIKRMCKPTKFQTISFDSEHEMPAGALYPDALLDVSLASRNRVLGRTCTFAHGESSGFFRVWACPVCMITTAEATMFLDLLAPADPFSYYNRIAKNIGRHRHTNGTCFFTFLTNKFFFEKNTTTN